MPDSARISLMLIGSVVAGFAFGFLLETVSGGSDSGAPPAGGLLGFGIGLVLVAVTSKGRQVRPER